LSSALTFEKVSPAVADAAAFELVVLPLAEAAAAAFALTAGPVAAACVVSVCMCVRQEMREREEREGGECF